MRVVTGFFVLLLVACTPGDPESYTTSANVDLAAIPNALAAIDAITDDALPVEELVDMANSVSMDEEKQERFAVSFDGKQTELLIHVWREQADWVHLYASSPSAPFIETIAARIKPFERADND